MLRLGNHFAPNGNERLFHSGASTLLQANIELGGGGGGICTCERFPDERYFLPHRKEHVMHSSSSCVVLPFACWRLTHGKAPHLTLAELAFINEKKQDGLTPVQTHARLAAQRTNKKIATPHSANVRKASKGKVYKRGRIETRGRRPKFTRAMVLRMDVARKKLIKQAGNQRDVRWDDLRRSARVPEGHRNTLETAGDILYQFGGRF